MSKNNKSSQQKTTHKQSKPASQVYSIDQKVYVIPLKTNGIVKGYDPQKSLYLITYFNYKNKRITKWFGFDQISVNIKVKLNKNEQVVPLMTEEGRKIVGDFIKQHKLEVHQDSILSKNDAEKLCDIAFSDYIKNLKEQQLLYLEKKLNEFPIIKGGMLDTYDTVKINVNELTKDVINDLKEQIEHYKALYLEYKNLYENQKTVNYINNKKETK